jgi:hypothetical protein
MLLNYFHNVPLSLVFMIKLKVYTNVHRCYTAEVLLTQFVRIYFSVVITAEKEIPIIHKHELTKQRTNNHSLFREKRRRHFAIIYDLN